MKPQAQAGTRNSQAGVALLSAIMVLMLMSALLVGFVAMVTADQTASGINRDQTQAYAGAHAGVEKLTADLGQLFAGNFAPTGAQIATLTTPAMQPGLPGISFLAPNGGTGYRITFRDTNGDNNPDVADPNGTQIAAGPYQGLVGLITPYDIEVTARTVGNAEVRMRRTMQTIGIPVFQFGIFSENDQSFFAGPNFAFGGRVHTNQNLFLKQDTNATLTLQDRVTAVGEIVRTHLANGVTGTHPGTVRMALAPGCPAAPTAANGSCRTLTDTEGSLVNTLGSAQNEPTWTDVSMGAYNGWIRNGRTGARRLDLPIVSDGATPADLIRRPPVGEVATSSIGRQRFFNMGTIRILLSDRAADITALPGVVGVPQRLAGLVDPAAWGLGGLNGRMAGATPFGVSIADQTWGDRTSAGTPRIDGFISIEMQQRDNTWVDITREILALGIAGRRLSNGTFNTADLDATCEEPHPNAVIRLQRTRDTIAGAAPTCGHNAVSKVLPAAGDYWPNVLYDPREGAKRDTVAVGQTQVWWSGVMHYVELDVNNLRRWLRSDIGSGGRNACINGAGGPTCPMDVTGFVVYFSDRRTNRNAVGGADPAVYTVAGGSVYGDDAETGEFGWEDNINTDANSTPNGGLDHPFVDAQGVNRWSEDVNANGVLDAYGNVPRLLPAAVGAGPWVAGLQIAPIAACPTPAAGVYDVWNTPVDPDVARVNRAFFFRRALKLVNGGRGLLPANGTQGLTVASENPVYVQGNYNACTNHLPVGSPLGPGAGGAPTFAGGAGNNFNPACVGGVGFGASPGVDHVSAAVIADAVTLLSNAWNDLRSFVVPHNAGANMGGVDTTAANRGTRLAATTWYRLGIIAGKPLNFPRASVNPQAGDNADFGTDGGAHNFLRYIENWGNWNNGEVGGSTLNYRGSILSFYTARQAVGTYKCCDNVYSPPNRGYNFDAEFLNPNLLPPRTPMFRDLNTLTFRQILRPTQ
jgi:hypothetical protein